MRKRYAYFPSFGPSGELTPTEEEAAAWLRNSPQLLNWPRKIHWLWSQVDSRNAIAHLWGIDSIGTLIIVEIRKDLGDSPDPFANLVLELKGRWTVREWNAEAVREKWRKGWPWEPLDGTHQRSVERLLARRSNVGNPHPVLVGVVASTRREFRLSSSARRNVQQLQKCVGDERVRLSIISGTLVPRRLRVQCITLDHNDQFAQAGVLAVSARRDRRRSRHIPC